MNVSRMIKRMKIELGISNIALPIQGNIEGSIDTPKATKNALQILSPIIIFVIQPEKYPNQKITNGSKITKIASKNIKPKTNTKLKFFIYYILLL